MKTAVLRHYTTTIHTHGNKRFHFCFERFQAIIGRRQYYFVGFFLATWTKQNRQTVQWRSTDTRHLENRSQIQNLTHRRVSPLTPWVLVANRRTWHAPLGRRRWAPVRATILSSVLCTRWCTCGRWNATGSLSCLRRKTVKWINKNGRRRESFTPAAVVGRSKKTK